MTKSKPAKGVAGCLLYSTVTKKHFFRVYDDDNFTDYDIIADDISIIIDDECICLYDELKQVDHSEQVLGKRKSTKIFKFYSENGKDSEGRTLEDILEQNFFWMEGCDDYIQWLFPLREESNFNPDAPLLTDSDIEAFKTYGSMGRRLEESFNKFLSFLGLEFDGTVVKKAENFEIRKGKIWQHPNHNWLRITRCLKSLKLLGLEKQCEAFFACLTELREEGYGSDNSYAYWKEGALEDEESKSWHELAKRTADERWEAEEAGSIPTNECAHGGLYRIDSRNLTFGVYRQDDKGFVGIREKFEDKYLFTEYHRDTGAPFGTVTPKELLEMCPLEDLSTNNQFLFEWLTSKEQQYAQH